MSESAVNHEHPESIAERFKDGFMHPNLEHDAERLAKGYLALQAERDKWETSFEKAADVLDDTQRQLRRAEAIVEAARRALDNGVLVEGGVLIADVGVATDLQIEVAAYDAARSGDKE